MSKYISSSPSAHSKDMTFLRGGGSNSLAKDVPKGMATVQSVTLSSPGKKERKAWGELCNLTTEMRSLVLGYPDAEVLLQQIMALVAARVNAERVDESKAISLLKNLIILVADRFNMIPLGNSVHLDMISRDTTFSEENVDAKIKNSAPNTPYTVLSIVEAQSSGEFYLPRDVLMDHKFERMQTTKEILMSRCIDSSTLILDISIKGLDERRTRQDTSFENQAALFALTVSHVMMVSISISNNGPEHGGNGLLFKTIFQEWTKLPQGLTKIVVVVRNYDRENLGHTVMEMLEKIWKSVNGKYSTFSSNEIAVVELHDENSQAFQKEVATLKKLLLKSTRSDKVAPSKNFLARTGLLWNQIAEGNIFDHPTHMMLLATLYFQQTVEARIGNFEDGVLKAEESPDDFTKVAHKLFGRSITQYTCASDAERQKMVNMELITKIQEKKSKDFKETNVRTNYEGSRDPINTEEVGDVLLNYYEKALEPYIIIFTNLCEDLKILYLENFENIYRAIRKELISYISLHILSLKEEDARNTLEAEQLRSDKDIEALTVRLDQRTGVKQRRELKLQQEKEQLEQQFKRAKEELDQANTKIAEFERTVKWPEQNKDKGEKEESILMQIVREIDGKCDKNSQLITQILEQMEGKSIICQNNKYEGEVLVGMMNQKIRSLE